MHSTSKILGGPRQALQDQKRPCRIRARVLRPITDLPGPEEEQEEEEDEEQEEEEEQEEQEEEEGRFVLAASD